MKLTLIAVILASACGSDASHGGAADASSNTDAPPRSTDGWTPLVGRSWTLPAGATNTYKCTRIQVASDMWVAGFRASSPLGTHHSVLTISTTNTNTGDYDCTAGSLDSEMLYAAGIGTDDLAFPPGVAMHITAGTYINLNLHLFNATDNPLADTSSVLVKLVQPADVVHEADMMFSGTAIFNIPNDGRTYTAEGGCTAAADWHLFTLWPHMHQTAVHQKWSFTPSGGAPQVLLDDDYSFTEQRNYPIADTLVHLGDVISTVCSYVNNTGAAIGFGDGSDKEMCFTGMYKYPAGGSVFQCATGLH